ncbi:nucleolar transcription factor 1-like isoform X2 [Scylla paramamosain]
MAHNSDLYPGKEDKGQVSPHRSFLEDFYLSTGSSSDSGEDQPCLASCRKTPLVLQGPTVCTTTTTTTATTAATTRDTPFNTKPWSEKDITYLLEGMRRQLPRVDNKSCLHTAKKISWEDVTFDFYTADDCRKTFEFLLSNIKLVKTMTAVIIELQEKVSRGSLKASLILQPRQQFVRDFAKKNKGLVAGVDLFTASAEAWRNLPEEDKEQYRREYIAAKEREIASMTVDEPPVRPKIPFELYYEELCKKKGKKNLDLKAVARQKYRDLDPKKKLKYIAMSATELYTFELQAAKHLVQQPEWVVPAQRGPSREDSEMYLRSLGMPCRPPNTASILYYHQKTKEGKFDSIHRSMRFFHAIDQFRKLSDHKKRKYREEHKQMVQEYSREYENWRKNQNEVVRSLADRLFGKKQVLPSGTLCRLQESSQVKEEAAPTESKLDRSDSLYWEAKMPCCHHHRGHHTDKDHLAESPVNKNPCSDLPSPDMKKLRQICKQEVFFNVEQPLEALMEKITLMLRGYEFLPSKVRQKFDESFKKWKYSLQASIIVDVRRMDAYHQQEFLGRYRDVCKRFFKHDIFRSAFPADR